MILRALNALVLATTLSGCAVLHPTLEPDGIATYRTDDGWENQIRHYIGEGPPVVLVHGMSVNHYNWDFREEVSLADYLRDEGWDVWVLELRGDPGSKPPSKDAAINFTFDDHATSDLPAAIAEIRRRTGVDQVFWVGHSMGGLLLYSYLSEHPEHIAAGVAIGAPGDFSHGLRIYRTVTRASWLLAGKRPLHNPAIVRLFPPMGRATPLLARFANPDNMDGPMLNGISRAAVIGLPRPMARQAITWLKARDLVTTDLTPYIRTTDVPLLLMAGPLDGVVSHDDVAATCGFFPHCDFVSLSEAAGFSTDYGHIDTVLGTTARTEVFPLIESFLRTHFNARTSNTMVSSDPEP